MIFKIEENTVVQVWESGKTLDDLQVKYPDADLREGDAVAGQVDVDGVLTNPVIVVPDSQLAQELWQSATDYEAQFIANAGFSLVTLGVIQNKPKALAVQTWMQNLWTDYQTRKADIQNTSTDFSNNGPMPFTILELMSE